MAEKPANTSPPADPVVAPVFEPSAPPENRAAEDRDRAIRQYAADIENSRRPTPGAQVRRLGDPAPDPNTGFVAGAVMPPIISADDIPPVGAFYSAAGASGTLSQPRDILASSVGLVVRGVSFDASTITADANGDKILLEGTVLSAVPASNPVKYRRRTSSQAATGIALSRKNFRDGNGEVDMMVGGRAWRPACIDDGTLGYPIAGGQPETDLRALGLYMHDYRP